jgi:phosphoribosylglycinamide formyltransferase-1
VTFRVVALASGSGTLFQALCDGQAVGDYRVVGLITDNPNADVIRRSILSGVPVIVNPLSDYADRTAWNQGMVEAIDSYRPDLIVSVGFMRVLGEQVVAHFTGRLINSHPALLPLFPGAHAVRDALQAGVQESGATVHYVDAGVDTGPIIAQRSVAVAADDTEASLHERIKVVERELIVEIVAQFAQRERENNV